MKNNCQMPPRWYLTLFCQSHQGFTLIELLVVVIILGVLGTVSLPMLLNQVGKSRETEALTTFGTLNRAQQAYHVEHTTFADSIDKLTGGNQIDIIGKFHEITLGSIDSQKVTYTATTINSINNARNLALGVYFHIDNFSYSAAICQGAKIGEPVNVGNTSDDNCTDGGKRLL